MSNNITKEESLGSGETGIRLPPISFLSGSHTHDQLSTLVLPMEKPNQSTPDRRNSAIFFQSAIGHPLKGKKVSLPEPQALNIYPQQDSATSPNFEHGTTFKTRLDADEQPAEEEIEQEAAKNQQRHRNTHHHHYQTHHHHHHSHSHHSHSHSKQNHHLHGHSHQSNSQKTSFGGDTYSASTRYAETPEQTTNALTEFRLNQAKRQKRLIRDKIYRWLSENFPERRHLGVIVYKPTTTWETLQFEQLHGLQDSDRTRLSSIREDFCARKSETAGGERTAYIPSIPPLSAAYINSLLEVKIPYKHLKGFLECLSAGTAERKRQLWGGSAGIYTDDSDLLYVLCHLGLFSGLLDLTDCNSEWRASDLMRPAHIQQDANGIELLDLSVTVLLLPSLNEYRGFYRNGINSRSWVGKCVHSGLSLAVYSVKWETFLLLMGDRSLSKKAMREYIDDKSCSTQMLS